MTPQPARMIIVCGPTGVGKTTHSISLAEDIGAIRFSIDPWMQTLFGDDMGEIEYAWMIERVHRCYAQIWDVCQKIFAIGGSVVLDLGFTEKAQREVFAQRARALGIVPQVHYLRAPLAVRRARVSKRNAERDPDVYAFDVTEEMIEFMEPRFEVSDEAELEHGRVVDTQ